MNGTVVSIVVLFLLMWGCVTCSSRQATNTETDTTINVVATAADGLDLKALGALVKNVSSAEELEKELNKTGGINNLDLNEDDQVDFITVTEYGNGEDEFGFSLTVEPEKGEVQEVANIEVIREKTQEQAVVQVHGNEQIYGHGHHYSATHAIGGILLMAYLLRPHPFWAPTYGWGYYPGYYSPYRTVTRTVYANNVRSVARNSTMSRVSQPKSTSINNPNKGKVANSGVKRSLANPTATQKAFQVRNPSKAVKSGGFGRSQGGNTVRSKSSSRSFGGRGK